MIRQMPEDGSKLSYVKFRDMICTFKRVKVIATEASILVCTGDLQSKENASQPLGIHVSSVTDYIYLYEPPCVSQTRVLIDSLYYTCILFLIFVLTSSPPTRR